MLTSVHEHILENFMHAFIGHMYVSLTFGDLIPHPDNYSKFLTQLTKVLNLTADSAPLHSKVLSGIAPPIFSLMMSTISDSVWFSSISTVQFAPIFDANFRRLSSIS